MKISIDLTYWSTVVVFCVRGCRTISPQKVILIFCVENFNVSKSEVPTMTVVAISELADNTIFIHFESLYLATLDITVIPEFPHCLVLGCWKPILSSPLLGEYSKVSHPSPLLVVDPLWSSLT